MKYNREYTSECISELKENEIFVFGSNLAGQHGGGAARVAYMHFGAEWGNGFGPQGRCFAIPTMQGGVETIRPYVDKFIEFARQNTDLKFLVTRIGCGIAGFRNEEIAPLFEDAIDVENIILPKQFVMIIEERENARFNLDRFLEAQQFYYELALREINEGCKRSHWFWFIFPQLRNLGHSYNAKFYGISGYDEAKAYLQHPVLGQRLRHITRAMLSHRGEQAEDILGDIDAMKLRSCMTLFDIVEPDGVFREVLKAFFYDSPDNLTLEYL